MTGIKWVFFDLGSTLVDESRVLESRLAYLSEHGHIARDELIRTVNRFSETSPTPYTDATAALGIPELLPPWDNSLEQLYPNVEEVLKILSAKYNLGVIANQNPGTEERLLNWGILPYFMIIAASAEEGCAKPDPRLFRIALERAGCLPEEAVMVGDRLENDIEPAKALGMKTIRILQSNSRFQKVTTPSRQADYTIEEIDELLKIL